MNIIVYYWISIFIILIVISIYSFFLHQNIIDILKLHKIYYKKLSTELAYSFFRVKFIKDLKMLKTIIENDNITENMKKEYKSLYKKSFGIYLGIHIFVLINIMATITYFMIICNV